MPVIDIPDELRERLGEKGTKAFIAVLDKFEHEIKDSLTTKTDLKELEINLRRDINELREEMHKSNIALLKWIAGMLFVFSTLIVGGIIGMLKL